MTIAGDILDVTVPALHSFQVVGDVPDVISPAADRLHDVAGYAPVLAHDRFRIVLINPYELGRQSFNLAAPAALLKAAGFDVICLDLALQKLDPAALDGAALVAIH